ncbi:hypothetical protein [Caulobacter mirabilis]|uniref:Uncharacterized protein n=1 Tax=Caulobacter mirabilis TaxID=69666 RepID=A0A2D2AYS7_9CAUL|nr:hypothetical protein [Caulobacter mirabilis]ATQ43135.1 hypothetical protein CSW64_12270 [Caulobacter mirabilis]
MEWLEQHEALAGWAQFLGAVLALFLTYITAFAPTWRRKRQLRDEAMRLLMHGYEVIESFHRTSAHFAPFQLSLRQAALSMNAAIEDLGRFPVYELDNNFGTMSLARRLMTMRMTVAAAKLFLDQAAQDIGDRTATAEEHEFLREMVGQQLKMAENLLMNRQMARPEWPAPGAAETA